MPVRESRPHNRARELETVRMGVLRCSGTSGSWMDCQSANMVWRCPICFWCELSHCKFTKWCRNDFAQQFTWWFTRVQAMGSYDAGEPIDSRPALPLTINRHWKMSAAKMTENWEGIITFTLTFSAAIATCFFFAIAKMQYVDRTINSQPLFFKAF